MLRSMITCTEGTAINTNLAILEPGAPGWDHARRAFDLAVDQHPAAVAVPTDELGVVAAVREARRRGLRVVAQCGGRGASRLDPLGDALLVRTAGLAGVEIDARAHRARIRAGARWADLAGRASFLGFAHAAEVLHAWRDWTETAPREITSVGRLMQFGDGPEVAELVRGRSFVVIEGAYLG